MKKKKLKATMWAVVSYGTIRQMFHYKYQAKEWKDGHCYRIADLQIIKVRVEEV